MEQQGTVLWFNAQKGYGFVKPDAEGAPDIFVHYSSIQTAGYKTLYEDDKVSYVIGFGPKGQQAESVKVIDSKHKSVKVIV
jgi:CspA family cold shock protein